MSLSEQDKQRIREEEEYRIEVRQELARKDPINRLKAAVFWIVLIAVVVTLMTVVRTGPHH